MNINQLVETTDATKVIFHLFEFIFSVQNSSDGAKSIVIAGVIDSKGCTETNKCYDFLLTSVHGEHCKQEHGGHPNN